MPTVDQLYAKRRTKYIQGGPICQSAKQSWLSSSNQISERLIASRHAMPSNFPFLVNKQVEKDRNLKNKNLNQYY
jgi:hypothetical protein